MLDRDQSGRVDKIRDVSFAYLGIDTFGTPDSSVSSTESRFCGKASSSSTNAQHWQPRGHLRK
jgi:hypothetical protein